MNLGLSPESWLLIEEPFYLVVYLDWLGLTQYWQVIDYLGWLSPDNSLICVPLTGRNSIRYRYLKKASGEPRVRVAYRSGNRISLSFCLRGSHNSSCVSLSRDTRSFSTPLIPNILSSHDFLSCFCCTHWQKATWAAPPQSQPMTFCHVAHIHCTHTMPLLDWLEMQLIYWGMDFILFIDFYKEEVSRDRKKT